MMQFAEVSVRSSKYPRILAEIDRPPTQLYLAGKITDHPAIAIVGSRKPSSYGMKITYDLSFQLAKCGFTIVSGLAYGVDTAAHTAALDAKGRTIAVLGCGLDQIYPVQNRPLAERIVACEGAIISEYPEGTAPLRQHFPARNRLISGLSLATLVTEATAKSGALITSSFAINQNRLVFAVPGNITSPLSAGPNNLIRSGAIPITSFTDILAELGIALPDPITLAPSASTEAERLIIGLLKDGCSSADEIMAKSGLTASQFTESITLMEIRGQLRNLGAGNWALR